MKHWLILLFAVVFLLVAMRYISGCGHPLAQFPADDPKVLAVVPADKAVSVSLSAEVTVTFDIAMDPATMTAAKFTLTSSSSPVTGTVTYDAASKTAKFTPSSALAYGTTYTATMAATVKSAEGREMELPYTWSFTTVYLVVTGALDPDFGTNGFVKFDGSSNSTDRGKGVAINSAGKILIAAQLTGFSYRAGVLCYNDNGTLDTGFGTSGLAPITDFAPESLTLDSSDNIYVVGWWGPMFLRKFKSDGSVDTSFGTGGTVSTNGPYGQGAAGYAALVNPSGKIYVAGTVNKISSHNQMCVWRYLANGSPDTDFNGTGLFTYDIDLGSITFVTIRSLAFDATGRLIVGGVVGGGTFDYRGVIWCVKPDGSGLDETFGDPANKGYVSNLIGASGVPAGVTVAPDGKILMTGTKDGNTMVWRYNSDGSTDTGFGVNGVVAYTVAIGGTNYDSSGVKITADRDGKVVVAGKVWTGELPIITNDLTIIRFNQNGTVDTGFSSGGITICSGSAGATTRESDDAEAIMLDPLGRILVTGSSVNANLDGDVGVWRFK